MYSITSTILSSIADIDRFRGRWCSLSILPPKRLESLRKRAVVDAVGATARAAGLDLTEEQAQELAAGAKQRAWTDQELEILGCYRVNERVFEDFARMPLNETTVRRLHADLFDGCQPEGEEEVGFNGAIPLFDKVNEDLRAGVWHPLLVISAFAYEFLKICPFAEGNGRLTRVLAQLLVLRAGYRFVGYSSLECVLERRQDELLKTQASSSLTTWIEFFLGCLKEQKDRLASKLEREVQMLSFPDLDERILSLVAEEGRASLCDLEAFTQANRNTLKTRLRRLVADGWLKQHGRAKATWYTSCV